MLTVEDYRKLNKGQIKTYDRAEISFEDLKSKAVGKIREACLLNSLENEDFKRLALDTITNYIYEARPYCEGYVRDGQLMVQTLITDLFNSITSWGMLTCFNEYPSMRELQMNGPSIFVDTKDGYSLLRDPKNNEILRFKEPEDATNFIKSTLNFSGERMTEAEPLVNASTIEGYRLSCTHPCIFPPHPSEPTLKWPTATYRKVGGGVLTREDFLRNHTACESMLFFIEITFKAMLGMVFVGTTGCGKTTLMELGLRAVSDKDRVICIQQPSEYHYRNIENGIMKNNSVYWEVDPQADPKKSRSATQDNLVTHSLRNTATLLMLGECRNGEDFASMARAINAGTRVCTSLHSFDIPGTIDRFALELVSKLGLDMEIAREQACTYLTTITLCDRLGDYSRKIMGQAEIIGYDRKNKSYIINYLFEFVLVDSVLREGDEGREGLTWNVGYFVKRSNPTPGFIRSMVKVGIQKSTLQEFMDIPIGSVLDEVHFDKLPENYIVSYDYNITPNKNSLRASRILSKEESIGIAI